MSGAGGVDYQGFYIGNVCQKGENVQIVDEFLGGFAVAFDFKCEDGACAAGEIFVVKLMAGVVGQRRMMNRLNLRMIVQIFNNLEGVFHVAFNTQRERFQTLQEEESVETVAPVSRSKMARI